MLTGTSPSPDDVLEAGGRWFDWLLGAPLQSLVAVVAGALLLAVLRWAITRTVRSVVSGGTTVRRRARRLLLRDEAPSSPDDQLAVARRVQRAETMGSVLRSAAGVVVVVVVVTALANINDWDLGPVIASAGVVGVALGFGAQTLVKDFLAGLFMLIEDQYGVGDVVDLGEASGVVEAVGLRVTRVRDLGGTLWYVRNGEILRVGNMTQGFSKALVEVVVPLEHDVDRATDLARGVMADVAADPELGTSLLADPEVTAYEDIGADGARLRLQVKTKPGQQWAVMRAVRGRLGRAFADAGIPFAPPRREVLVERPEGLTAPGRPERADG